MPIAPSQAATGPARLKTHAAAMPTSIGQAVRIRARSWSLRLSIILDSLERMYDSGVVGELVGHWWNGRHGTASRRDIRLEGAEAAWTLEARRGGQTIGRWVYDDEQRARAAVAALQAR
jgi:hypothetical protein